MVDFSHLPEIATPDAAEKMREQVRNFPEIRTPRLRLRPFSLSREMDVRRLTDLLGNSFVSSWIYFFKQPFTEVEAYKWIARSEAEQEAGTFVLLAVEYADTDTLVGEIHIDFSAQTLAADLGGSLDKPFWGKGFAEEGMRAAIDHLYHGIGCETLIMTTATNNRPAQRVISWLGFPYKRDTIVLRTDGSERPTKFYEQTKREWARWWRDNPNPERSLGLVAQG